VLVLRFAGATSVGLRKTECRSSVNTTLDVAVRKEKSGTMPSRYALEQNYPNPFNPTTVIEYQTLEAGRVTLEVFSVLGEKVATLVNGFQEAGYYQQEWNGRDQSGRQVASGLYIYRLQAGDFSGVRSMVLMK
jgi:flagellar hook assembly protein FlgD